MVTKKGLCAALFAAVASTLDDIPALGLGTWLSDRDSVPHAVEFGLKNGYEHIDAAWIYRASLPESSSIIQWAEWADLVDARQRR